jgi:hypothetical protein
MGRRRTCGAAWSTHPDDLVDFAERHRVNIDWLLSGKLAGLLDTVRNQPELPPAASPEIRKAQDREIIRLLAGIDRQQLPTVLPVLRTFEKPTGGNASAQTENQKGSHQGEGQNGLC